MCHFIRFIGNAYYDKTGSLIGNAYYDKTGTLIKTTRAAFLRHNILRHMEYPPPLDGTPVALSQVFYKLCDTGVEAEVERLLRPGSEVLCPDIITFNGWTCLHSASSNGDTRIVHLILERLLPLQPSLLNFRRWGGQTEGTPGAYTALMLAAHNNHLGTVIKLIQFGANVHATVTRDGDILPRTALAISCARPSTLLQAATVKALLEAGAGMYFIFFSSHLFFSFPDP